MPDIRLVFPEDKFRTVLSKTFKVVPVMAGVPPNTLPETLPLPVTVKPLTVLLDTVKGFVPEKKPSEIAEIAPPAGAFIVLTVLLLTVLVVPPPQPFSKIGTQAPEKVQFEKVLPVTVFEVTEA